ncbi:MAG: hypothetical protein U0411_09510 [Thermodesulfovibrionales bacterium]
MKTQWSAGVLAAAIAFGAAALSYGSGENPFMEAEKPVVTVVLPGRGAPKAPPGVRSGSLNEELPFVQASSPQPPARTERKWQIKGKVNDMVVIIDEKGERIHAQNGELFEGCLIRFPSAVCDRDAVIKTLQEKLERERMEKNALAKEAVDLRAAFAQKEKARADIEKSAEDLAFQRDDSESALERLRKEHGEVLARLQEIQAAWEQSLRDGNAVKSVLHEKEAAFAQAVAEAVRHKTDSMSLLEATAQREQCITERETIRSALKEREAEALGAGVLAEYVQKSGERVSTEEYGEIIVKEMDDSLIVGVSRTHSDQAERALVQAARAKILHTQFIFYLLAKSSVDFAPLPSGQTVKAVKKEER